MHNLHIGDIQNLVLNIAGLESHLSSVCVLSLKIQQASFLFSIETFFLFLGSVPIKEGAYTLHCACRMQSCQQVATFFFHALDCSAQHMRCIIRFPVHHEENVMCTDILVTLCQGETLRQVAEYGIPGMILPFCNSGIRMPVHLMNLPLQSIYLHSAGVGSAENMGYYAERQPWFDNMCGSILMPGFRIPDNDMLPPLPNEEPSNAKLQASHARKKLWKRRRQASSVVGAQSKRQIFSVYGNLVMRKELSGICVTFKVKFDLH